MEGAKISDDVMIGPNSVVPPGRFIPTGQLWAGNPVQFIRNLTPAEKYTIKWSAEWHKENGHRMVEEYSFNKTGYLFKENSPGDMTFTSKESRPLIALELDEGFFPNGMIDRI